MLFMKRLELAAALFLIGFGNLLPAADEIELFLEPDTEGAVFATETLSTLNEKNPTPYPADVEVTEWMRVDYPGNYVGYVEPSMINKDLSVREGAKVLLKPNKDSTVLTLVDGEVAPQVIELQEDWVTVFYEGTAPAYFRWPATAPVVDSEAITVATASAPAAAASPAAASTAPAPPPARPPVPLTEPAPPPAAKPAPVAPATPAEVPAAAASNPPTQLLEFRPEPLTSPSISRPWEGKLIKLKGFDTWWTDYEYALENAAGVRIAYIDVSETLLFRPMESYDGAQVVVMGTAQRIKSTVPVVVKARYIRPKN